MKDHIDGSPVSVNSFMVQDCCTLDIVREDG